MMRQRGNEAGAGEVQQPGNQLAARQIAGRADQHDHLRKTRSDARLESSPRCTPLLLVENTPRGEGFTTSQVST